jgi:putative addiction module component (TIGR02574 family)
MHRPAKYGRIRDMNQRIKTIFEQAQRLAPAEREELAELLLATIDDDPGVAAAWQKEFDDRIAAHERGEMTTRPAAEVLAKYLVS